jgi:acyl-CoA hydrolase
MPKGSAEMNLEFETSFAILPKHCNWMYPMIFGGAFFSELDLCAASCVNRLLHDSHCDTAVTHKYEGTFHAAAECGDIIFLRAEVVELRHKAVVVMVQAHRERRARPGRDFIAEAKFVYVTIKDGEFHPHGLTMLVPQE